MSLKDRLTKKTEGIVQAARDQKPSLIAPQTPVAKTLIDTKSPKTGPGQMLAFRTHMQENTAKVQELEDKLRVFDDALPTRKLDPMLIRPSKWANRHRSSFLNQEFLDLKREIEAAGGNIQPIMVRPLKDSDGEFEIIFGHRRHQACLELKIPVFSVVDDVTDKQLFAAMDRENRARADLSPFEQGDIYRRALDEGLYTSLRALCSDIGVDPGNASKAIAIARLPSDILSAFSNPTEIQFRWGQLIQKALDTDPEEILKTARDISKKGIKLPAKDVLSLLIKKERKTSILSVDFSKNGVALGHLVQSTDGAVKLELKSGVLTDEGFNKLKDFVETVINP